jgi:hypothetical protein
MAFDANRANVVEPEEEGFDAIRLVLFRRNYEGNPYSRAIRLCGEGRDGDQLGLKDLEDPREQASLLISEYLELPGHLAHLVGTLGPQKSHQSRCDGGC